MIQAIINTMIGPLGRGILAFYFANQSIINVVFLIWAGMMTYASIQLNKVRQMTIKLAVEMLESNPQQSDDQIWSAFRPKWQEEVDKLNPRLILSRRNIWVSKPTPENLIEVMCLGPDWFAALRKGEVLRLRFATFAKNDRIKIIKK